ncbi:hypothetical protein [Frondihabitans sucicola]|uniref:hypothetical protein n=1 Tax=Frondihabitans sucicola TaxID=1268041 RepID=UPI002572AB0E|nr:hypothetical protein [Frondihabitans sucicola]
MLNPTRRRPIAVVAGAVLVTGALVIVAALVVLAVWFLRVGYLTTTFGTFDPAEFCAGYRLQPPLGSTFWPPRVTCGGVSVTPAATTQGLMDTWVLWSRVLAVGGACAVAAVSTLVVLAFGDRPAATRSGRPDWAVETLVEAPRPRRQADGLTLHRSSR